MFYGSHGFLFTLFNHDIDATSIYKWLHKIGKDNVALLREVVVVTRIKKDFKFANYELKRTMKKLGLRTEDIAEFIVVRSSSPSPKARYQQLF